MKFTYIIIGLIIIGLVIVEILFRRKKKKESDRLYKDIKEWKAKERIKRINGIKS